MAPAAPLNVRSVLHVKTVIWYFSVTAWRSSSSVSLKSAVSWPLSACGQTLMIAHILECTAGELTPVLTLKWSLRLSLERRERIITRWAAAQSCRCWRPCLHLFGKKEPVFAWNYLKGSSTGTSEHTDVGDTASTGLRLQRYSWQEEYEQSGLPWEH